MATMLLIYTVSLIPSNCQELSLVRGLLNGRSGIRIRGFRAQQAQRLEAERSHIAQRGAERGMNSEKSKR